MNTTLKDLFEKFCEENESYDFEADYSGVSEEMDNCIGISLPKEDSYMEMLMALTEYLDEQDFDDPNLELSNPMIDELPDRVVVYFPFAENTNE